MNGAGRTLTTSNSYTPKPWEKHLKIWLSRWYEQQHVCTCTCLILQHVLCTRRNTATVVASFFICLFSRYHVLCITPSSPRSSPLPTPPFIPLLALPPAAASKPLTASREMADWKYTSCPSIIRELGVERRCAWREDRGHGKKKAKWHKERWRQRQSQGQTQAQISRERQQKITQDMKTK